VTARQARRAIAGTAGAVSAPSARAAALAWLLDCGSPYWSAPQGRALVAARLEAETTAPMPQPSRTYVRVPLPDWAVDIGVGAPAVLLVDAVTCRAPSGDAEMAPWQRCDWAAAAWLHLTGAHERASEAHRGPAHSYSFAIDGFEPALHDHAWVNRIFLFLRRLLAREADGAETMTMGALPAARLILTHDVDAVRLTPEIRLKQGGMQVLNAARELTRRRAADASARMIGAARFALARPDWWTFEEVRRLEERHGVRSTLNFYGGPPGWRRGPRLPLILDPGYDIASPRLRAELQRFRDGGWTIGLHGSWRSWADDDRLTAERSRIREAADAPIEHTRQHWLRFSWESTWRAQERAGLTTDATLGFNDRPGFRNGAALAFHPWDHVADRPMRLTALPMVVMDSHFYDYQLLDEAQRHDAMRRWIDEVRAVGGTATLNWHTHTMAAPYGWGDGYRALLAML